ncbi:Hypothetical protein SCF082_LOCUS24828, partial [Durusdinium trenchii]
QAFRFSVLRSAVVGAMKVRCPGRTLAASVLLGLCLCRTFVAPLRSARGAGSPLAGLNPRPRSSHLAMRATQAEETAAGVRVGLIHCVDIKEEWSQAFEALNVTNETYFQTQVPDSFQLPLAAKLLAMSNTVDVIVAIHSIEDKTDPDYPELLRGFQTVALTANVPIVHHYFDGKSTPEEVADRAVQMGEIRQQALLGGGPRKSIFFGIGANKTGDPKKGGKIYF